MLDIDKMLDIKEVIKSETGDWIIKQKVIDEKVQISVEIDEKVEFVGKYADPEEARLQRFKLSRRIQENRYPFT